MGTNISTIDVLGNDKLFYEKLIILSDNVVSDLSFTPINNNRTTLIINGVETIYYNENFTLSGVVVTLLPSTYGFNISNDDIDEVHARYYKA